MTTTDWLGGLTALIRGLMIIVTWAEKMKGKLEKELRQKKEEQ